MVKSAGLLSKGNAMSIHITSGYGNDVQLSQLRDINIVVNEMTIQYPEQISIATKLFNLLVDDITLMTDDIFVSYSYYIETDRLSINLSEAYPFLNKGFESRYDLTFEFYFKDYIDDSSLNMMLAKTIDSQVEELVSSFYFIEFSSSTDKLTAVFNHLLVIDDFLNFNRNLYEMCCGLRIDNCLDRRKLNHFKIQYYVKKNLSPIFFIMLKDLYFKVTHEFIEFCYKDFKMQVKASKFTRILMPTGHYVLIKKDKETIGKAMTLFGRSLIELYNEYEDYHCTDMSEFLTMLHMNHI